RQSSVTSIAREDPPAVRGAFYGAPDGARLSRRLSRPDGYRDATAAGRCRRGCAADCGFFLLNCLMVSRPRRWRGRLALANELPGCTRFRHQRPDGGDRRRGDEGEPEERDRAAEMIGQIAGERRADRGADTDPRPDDTLREAKTAGAARNVGDH